jgi:NAD(P)-dependent dehydrogenase (short-subunit alcohol dehydrogenase family)
MARVVLVTGGSGALGQAIVLRFLGDGASVCVPYVVPAERERLIGRVSAADRDRLLLEDRDVTDVAAMDVFVKSVLARFRRVDVLVSAVGGFAGGGLVDTDLGAWERMLKMNLTSAFVAARAVVPSMRSNHRGRIINIASRAVLPPAAGFIGYTVSKAAVITFTEALAEELRADGITVNAVAPSTMDTPGNRAAMPNVDPKTWVPVERVADAIAFLASESAGHVTGTLLKI